MVFLVARQLHVSVGKVTDPSVSLKNTHKKSQNNKLETFFTFWRLSFRDVCLFGKHCTFYDAEVWATRRITARRVPGLSATSFPLLWCLSTGWCRVLPCIYLNPTSFLLLSSPGGWYRVLPSTRNEQTTIRCFITSCNFFLLYILFSGVLWDDTLVLKTIKRLLWMP